MLKIALMPLKFRNYILPIYYTALYIIQQVNINLIYERMYSDNFV